jgi:hypothetical protein
LDQLNRTNAEDCTKVIFQPCKEMEKKSQPLLVGSSHHVYIEVKQVNRGKLRHDTKIFSQQN